jgi:hypothetical protein
MNMARCWVDSCMSKMLDRDPATGFFVKGNQAAKGNGHPSVKRLLELRVMWVECVSEDRMKRIEEEVFRIATEEVDPRVRLAACVEWLNRTMGKSVQEVNVQTETRSLNVHAEVSPEEQRVLEAVIARQKLSLPAAPVELPAPR